MMTKWTLSSGSDVLSADFSYKEAHVIRFASEVLGADGFSNLCRKLITLTDQAQKLSAEHSSEDVTCSVADEDGAIIMILPPSDET